MTASDALTKYDIKPSLIRIMIYDYLKGTRSHPCAEDIYKETIKKVPTLSRTTVYNTVKLFASKGLIKELPIDGEQIHYDADICFHGHFLCNSCRRIYDFELTEALESVLEGFKIEQREVFYSGCCRECKN